MSRINPGPFEPFIYFAQTRPFYRLVAVGGFALFTILALREAALYGGALAFFVLAGMFVANWLDMSLAMCRRCRHYATWHCGGQAVIVSKLAAVSKLFAPRTPGVSDARATFHLILTAVFLLYGLFWLWHSIALGIIFTLWVPLAAISAIAPGGFSWRKAAPASKAA
ncbi:MAG TPA: hypothetical protein VNE82_20885 [Candidatus Binataceae bacterium]|nr:hypothetical protein [Candidatus Binataceae bacterium]